MEQYVVENITYVVLGSCVSKTHRVPWYLLCRLKPTMGIVSIIKKATRYPYRFLPADELKDALS